ncbi:hypothetical protein [Candidatus Mycoplasma mahonii]|uniref:hypothetical protein n=1 Tax=Candidatus Mycoplasma mahonii TaxID=3004105 RepID=UPI0026EE313F|nr:hypothetical protein [Candidatus Mycoplasma mahonii]WKX02392.1 hypothetical protein O3I44_03275 [Candidatus Mycoplasma mahonii]
MLLNKKAKVINVKDLSKKVNWLLGRNFYSIQDFKVLSSWRQYKVLKMIVKIEGLVLTRSEIKDMIKMINNEFAGNVDQIKLLLPNVGTLILFEKVTERVKDVFVNFIFIITFRSNKFELMRN